MAITLTGSGGIFTRLGALLGIYSGAYQYQNVTLPTGVTNYLSQFPESLAYLTGDTAQSLSNWQSQLEPPLIDLQGQAAAILLQMAQADPDAATQARNTNTALQALIRQMIASSNSVQKHTLGFTTTAFSTNSGNGTIATTLTSAAANGTTLITAENMWVEEGNITCTADSVTGGTAVGSESFQYRGLPAVSDIASVNWPAGSGASTGLTCVNPLSNSIADGSFANVSSSAFTNWTGYVGVYGTDYQQSTAIYLPIGTNTTSLKINGGLANVDLRQQFSGTQNSFAIQPNTVYAVGFWVYVATVPAAGVIEIDLCNSSGTTVQDNGSNNNLTSVTLSGLVNATWTIQTAFFRTPRVLPASGTFMRVKVSTGISSGTTAYVDGVMLSACAPLYTGGPYAAIYAGLNKWIFGDGWQTNATNNFGAASGTYNDWQLSFQRLFNSTSNGLYLPFSNSPTISNTLIAT